MTVKTKSLGSTLALGLLALVITHLPVVAQSERVRLTLKGCWRAPIGEPAEIERIHVADGHAYVLRSNVLDVVDVSDPTALVRLSNYNAEEHIRHVQVFGSYAYLAEGTTRTGTNDGGAFDIINVSNSTNPVPVGRIETRGRANRVYLAGNYAYVAESTRWTGSNQLGGMTIFCVTNPAAPTFVYRCDTTGSVQDVQIVGRYAYLAGGEADLLVIDISNPLNPMRVGTFNADQQGQMSWFAGAVQVLGNYAYVMANATRLYMLDISNPAQPARVSDIWGGILDDGGIVVISSVQVTDRYVCVAQIFSDGPSTDPVLSFIDTSNPTKWVWLGSYYNIRTTDLLVAGKYLYAAADGLLVFEITELPYFKSVSRIGDKLVLTWNGALGVKLQRTASLTHPAWTDVLGSEGQSRVELPMNGGNEFFRLVKP